MMRLALAIAVLGATAGAAQGTLIKMTFPMDGLQEVPPKVTPGFGTGKIELDTDTNLLKWNIVYQDLLGPTVAAHFHAPAPFGVNAPPVIDFGDFGSLLSPIVGETTITAAQTQQILDGLWYVNIHSSVFTPGEIRGQVVPGPAVLAPLALAGIALRRRR